MDVKILQELEELFRHRWDALALITLSHAPRRFGELGAAMHEGSSERLADGVLSRTLARLIGRGLVEKSVGADERRSSVYQLTAAGHVRAARLSRLVVAVQHEVAPGQPVATAGVLQRAVPLQAVHRVGLPTA